MSIKQWPDKAEGASRIYSVDWSRFLRDRSTGAVTLAACEYSSHPAGLVFSAATITDGKITTVTIGGGSVAGSIERPYLVRHRLTLSNGEVEEQCVPLNIVRHKLL